MNPSAPPTPIWLIEDNAAFRRSVARTIETLPDFSCTGSFSRCEEALAALRQQEKPRIILLDVGLPGIDGITALPQLRAAAPEADVIIFTVFEDEDKIVRAISAGAAGYLLKTAPPEEITRALREVLAGGSPMNGRIARRVLEMFSRLTPAKGNYHLTPRERSILELLTAGLIKKEIASQLNLSIYTVDTHLRNIYAKLEVSTNTGAVAKALREKLL